MARSTAVELDFFSMEKRTDGPRSSMKPPIFERRRSFRDIQGVISKMNPQIVKNVIASGCNGNSNQTWHNNSQAQSPNLAACDPALRLSNGYQQKNVDNETAPMTIFYNGMVAVFDVPPHKAHDILKVADKNNHKTTHAFHENLVESLDGDLPITRKNSLQRFLGKRKERLIEGSPYSFNN